MHSLRSYCEAGRFGSGLMKRVPRARPTGVSPTHGREPTKRGNPRPGGATPDSPADIDEASPDPFPTERRAA